MNPLRPMEAEFVTEGELAGRAYAELEDLDLGGPVTYRTNQGSTQVPVTVCQLPLANRPQPVTTYPPSRLDLSNPGLLSGDPLSITEEQLNSAIDHLHGAAHYHGYPSLHAPPQEIELNYPGGIWRLPNPSHGSIPGYPPQQPKTPPYAELRGGVPTTLPFSSQIDAAESNLPRSYPYPQSPGFEGSYENRVAMDYQPGASGNPHRLINPSVPGPMGATATQPPPLYHYQSLTGLPPSMEQLYTHPQLSGDVNFHTPEYPSLPHGYPPPTQPGHVERLLPTTYPPKVGINEAEELSNPFQPKFDASFIRKLRGRGKHGRKDGLKFECTLCRKQYCRRSTLKAHLRQHSGERPYQCPVCGKSFSQAANLTAHRRVHTGEKPFCCSICYRPFSQSSSLVTHRRTHTGERPYACPHCDKAFTDSSTLTKHMRTHTGHKPYECTLCGLSFSQSGNLNRHMKTHVRQQNHQDNQVFV